MSQANLEQLQHLVLQDTVLQERLRETADRDEFLALLLRAIGCDN
jgi:Nif11 domain